MVFLIQRLFCLWHGHDWYPVRGHSLRVLYRMCFRCQKTTPRDEGGSECDG
jgi:hypothetical protein